TLGSYNTAIGNEALKFNNTGSNNIAVGYEALYENTTGNSNVAIGIRALYYNQTRSKLVAVGDSALFTNGFGASNAVHATQNVAVGSKALFANTTGHSNTAIGFQALINNTTGFLNTAVGHEALEENTTGWGNTAVGYASGDEGVNNNYCSYFGYLASSAGSGYNNSMAFGYNSYVTASNQVRVGNSSVTSIGGYANWTNVSDARFKKDVQENVPGLDFIMRLRPVTYHLDVTGLARFLGEGEFRPKVEGREHPEPDATTLELDRKARAEKEKILYTGFIAQEVEQAAREIGYDFSGVDKPQNEHSLYGLRYAEFVVPLVKAVQQQQHIIESQRARIEALEKSYSEMKTTLESLLSTGLLKLDR
ncbi:MAG: tail fiber domain-containing protein, partial [Flavobacteriales bacterium]|nr:tail fiber domain-containing protein [Flavobacteriales bacterium]